MLYYIRIIPIIIATLISIQVYGVDTIKIGGLYSQQGTMAISESKLKTQLTMLIEQQNAKGGVLGKPLELIALDPKSNWPMYGEKLRELIKRHKVVATFGGWTSASRLAMKPVVEEMDSLLFYPLQYEGQESSKNIFYTGATPNQQAIPAVKFLMEQKQIERWILVGTDYIYPRVTNDIIRSYLNSLNIPDKDILLIYSRFGQQDWINAVEDIKKFATKGKRTAIVSTINGDANIYFYLELAKQQIRASDIPVMAFSIGEEELSKMNDATSLTGHYAAWNYFMSLQDDINQQEIKRWQEYNQQNSSSDNQSNNSLLSDPMESQAIAFKLWVKAVEKTGSTDAALVARKLMTSSASNFTGLKLEMNANHHLSKPVYIGKINSDGQFDIVWQSQKTIKPQPWSPYIEPTDNYIADWLTKKCGKFNIQQNQCEQ